MTGVSLGTLCTAACCVPCGPSSCAPFGLKLMSCAGLSTARVCVCVCACVCMSRVSACDGVLPSLTASLCGPVLLRLHLHVINPTLRCYFRLNSPVFSRDLSNFKTLRVNLRCYFQRFSTLCAGPHFRLPFACRAAFPIRSSAGLLLMGVYTFFIDLEIFSLLSFLRLFASMLERGFPLCFSEEHAVISVFVWFM